jgi:predicted alpha/beta-hydrolase family hydrolase
MITGFTEFHTGEFSGFLHQPAVPNGDAIALTHGAGGNCRMQLLMVAAQALASAGYMVVRYDLPFRRKRATGPPSGNGAADREGIQTAAEVMRTLVGGRVILGGQSYGGRQTTILCAEKPEVAPGLLLFSYPLHAPGKPHQLRTSHFPGLRVPAHFIQGSTDPFASPDEMREAIRLIPARTSLSVVQAAGHDLRHGNFDFAVTAIQPLHDLGFRPPTFASG